MTYDEMLTYINQSNTWSVEHLYTSWALALPVELIKYDQETTECIPAEFHQLCIDLFNLRPEGAVKVILDLGAYTEVTGRTVNYRAPILLNHSCKTYVVFGDILEVYEDGKLTQYEKDV